MTGTTCSAYKYFYLYCTVHKTGQFLVYLLCMYCIALRADSNHLATITKSTIARRPPQETHYFQHLPYIHNTFAMVRLPRGHTCGGLGRGRGRGRGVTKQQSNGWGGITDEGRGAYVSKHLLFLF